MKIFFRNTVGFFLWIQCSEVNLFSRLNRDSNPQWLKYIISRKILDGLNGYRCGINPLPFLTALTSFLSLVCKYPMVYFDCKNITAGTSGAECQKSCQTLDLQCVSITCLDGMMVLPGFTRALGAKAIDRFDLLQIYNIDTLFL